MFEKLKKSPINYFSDLFMVTMVLAFLFTVIVMLVMAIYSTIINQDNSIWDSLGTLVAVPLSAGGAMWLLRCLVVHKSAAEKGEIAEPDFADPGEPEEVNDENSIG